MDVTQALLSLLNNFGIEVTPTSSWEHAVAGAAPQVTLRRRDSAQLYTVVSLLTTPNAIGLTDPRGLGQENRILIIAERLNARTMTACRNRGFDYIDLSGNALLSFGDVYIDVQGRTNLAKPTTKSAHQSPVNVFSTRRSQVIFALMIWPELFTLPIRSTSEAAGVSMGSAYQTVQVLREVGYVQGDASPRIVRRSELVDRWTDAFGPGLSKKLLLGRYHSESLRAVGTNLDDPPLVSGESAVPGLLRPTTLTVYIGELDSRLIATNRWRSDSQPNIEVRRRFWSAPGRNPPSDAVVPPLLIYADLMTSGDGRQREAAQAYRQEHSELIDG